MVLVGLSCDIFGVKVVLNETEVSVNMVVFGGSVGVISVEVLGGVAFTVVVFVNIKVVFVCVVSPGVVSVTVREVFGSVMVK